MQLLGAQDGGEHTLAELPCTFLLPPSGPQGWESTISEYQIKFKILLKLNKS